MTSSRSCYRLSAATFAGMGSKEEEARKAEIDSSPSWHLTSVGKPRRGARRARRWWISPTPNRQRLTLFSTD